VGARGFGGHGRLGIVRRREADSWSELIPGLFQGVEESGDVSGGEVDSAAYGRLGVEIGDEVKVTIPIEMKTEIEKELKEAELSVIQGNYNEVLVLLLLYTLSVPGVKIAKKYEKYRDDIIKSVQKWKNDLKTKVSSSQFAKAETIIQKGSEDMVRYLVAEAVKNDSVIIGGYSDNLSFQRGGISSKADIQLFIKNVCYSIVLNNFNQSIFSIILIENQLFNVFQ
jgi:hypothetical protein